VRSLACVGSDLMWFGVQVDIPCPWLCNCWSSYGDRGPGAEQRPGKEELEV